MANDHSAAGSIYAPLETIETAVDDASIFRGASVNVYEPLEFASENATAIRPSLAGNRTGQQLTSSEISASSALSTNVEITSEQDSAIARPKPHEVFPAAKISRGEIAEPISRSLTEDLGTNLGLSLGAVLLSATLDRGGDRAAREHGQSPSMRGVTKIGNALPFIALGVAGIAALDSSDARLSRTGLSALQAGGLSAASGLGLKYVFARARPEADLGPSQFHASGAKTRDSSLPSIHAATTWGAITPFAKEYDMPWLYGVAAISNVARVADRKHWVSDTVAGSLLGYWLGDIAWHHNRADDRSGTQVYLGDRSISFSWAFQ